MWKELTTLTLSVSVLFHILSCVCDFSGEEMYTCVWLKRRGVNVLEFQLGKLVCLVNAVSRDK